MEQDKQLSENQKVLEDGNPHESDRAPIRESKTLEDGNLHGTDSAPIRESKKHEDGNPHGTDSAPIRELKKMFDIEGATVTKTQYCPVGRWVFTLSITALFAVLYGVCMWGVRLFYGSLQIFLYCLLTAALAFCLFRVWPGFVADLRGQSFAEKITFLRHGEKRYYYAEGRAVKKFEYGGGGIAVTGKSYDKIENKADYSPLAGRYNKALQRRSSLYATLTAAFWGDILRDMHVTVTEHMVSGISREGYVRIESNDNGKIKKIEYMGNGYLLYDSLSPVKIFDTKFPGKYRIVYTFEVSPQAPIVLPHVFGTALKEYGMPIPLSSCVQIENEREGEQA